MTYPDYLASLREGGNFRRLPDPGLAGAVDLSSNDYLGLASRPGLQSEFFDDPGARLTPMTASASRLLAGAQAEFQALEAALEREYRRPALLFNSGYHANSGLIPALCLPGTVVVADKLAHASIIDGIVLSRAPFDRFRHNDLRHLERLLQKHAQAPRVLIVAESVYSMDGDSPDLDALCRLKRQYPNAMLYVDEAHAVGVLGPRGLGLTAGRPDVDVMVGTFGKALASAGAFAVMDPVLRDVAVNRARSLIFSTAMAPMTARYTRFMFEKMLTMDTERLRLRQLAQRLQQALGSPLASHIQPLIVGSAARAVDMSRRLLDQGFKVLPIRTPTVPPGTERLRFSLSAALEPAALDRLAQSLARL